MLRSNLWTSKGLVNGSLGKVVDILYDDEYNVNQPYVIICTFNSYKGPYLDDTLKTVPIPALLRSWQSNGEMCSRLQFPIQFAYGITIHK